jgi:hypothetical protein
MLAKPMKTKIRKSVFSMSPIIGHSRVSACGCRKIAGLLAPNQTI